MIEIEKNIPIPHRKCQLPGKYPLRDMEVGDSFLVPAATDGEKMRLRNSILGCTRSIKAGTTKRFSTRTEKDGIRCWRIE